MIAFRKIFSSGWVVGAAPLALLAVLGGAFGIPSNAAENIVVVPAPLLDEAAGATGSETLILAGGCFWGIQGVFQHVKGVENALSGYAGGTLANPTYDDVITETTGHAEAVKINYDPKQVTLGKLLQIFFSVAHDPTTLNKQGGDVGTSYRSAIFTMSEDQKKIADAYIAQLDAAKVFPAKIVTEVTPYTNFFQAEDYHQDNATTLGTNAAYVIHFDLPKIENLKTTFPELWQEKPKLVFAANAS